MIAGTLMAAATLIGAWAAVDVALALWAAWLAATNRQRPPVWACFLAAALAPGMLWSADAFLTGMTVARVLGASTVGAWILRVGTRRELAAGIFAGLAVSTVYAAGEILSPTRGHGLNRNASELGQAGVIAWAAVAAGGWQGWVMLATAAVSVPSSLSRAAMIALGMWAVAARSKRRLFQAGGVFVLFMVVSSLYGDPGRVSQSSVVASNVAVRVETVTGAVGPVPPPGPERATTQDQGTGGRRYLPLGYGTGALWQATKAMRPHNWPQIIVLELGLLAVAPFGLAIWAAVTRRIPGEVLIGLAPLVFLTDEMVAAPGGHYGLALILLATLRVPTARRQPGQPTPQPGSREPTPLSPARYD
jgi:hypothetical protein